MDTVKQLTQAWVLVLLLSQLYNFLYFQVQLLVSNQDVDNYKQIKADLDQLRLTVEKSELWVEKSINYESGEMGDNQTKGGEEPIEVGLKPLLLQFFRYE